MVFLNPMPILASGKWKKHFAMFPPLHMWKASINIQHLSSDLAQTRFFMDWCANSPWSVCKCFVERRDFTFFHAFFTCHSESNRSPSCRAEHFHCSRYFFLMMSCLRSSSLCLEWKASNCRWLLKWMMKTKTNCTSVSAVIRSLCDRSPFWNRSNVVYGKCTTNVFSLFLLCLLCSWMHFNAMRKAYFCSARQALFRGVLTPS